MLDPSAPAGRSAEHASALMGLTGTARPLPLFIRSVPCCALATCCMCAAVEVEPSRSIWQSLSLSLSLSSEKRDVYHHSSVRATKGIYIFSLILGPDKGIVCPTHVVAGDSQIHKQMYCYIGYCWSSLAIDIRVYAIFLFFLQIIHIFHVSRLWIRV